MYGFYCVPYVLYNCKNQKSENFLHFDNILSMKELNTPYRKMALMKQDKKGGLEHAKEGYQRLQTFYRVIGNYIVENKGADCDEEEGDQVETFRSEEYIFLHASYRKPKEQYLETCPGRKTWGA